MIDTFDGASQALFKAFKLQAHTLLTAVFGRLNAK
jgi:hypothetical protein